VGIDYRYEHGPAAEIPWYRSLWFLLLVIFAIALLVGWITVARHRAEEIVQSPPQTILNSNPNAAPPG
jgi:hypothetical protein